MYIGMCHSQKIDSSIHSTPGMYIPSVSHCKDSHDGMDDHATSATFWPWHMCIYIYLIHIYIYNIIYIYI